MRWAVLAAALAFSSGIEGQTPAEPVLRGRVLLADSALTQGTVVLHHITSENQGELDSVRVAGDGSFSFRLPSVPDPERSEIYFASLRHQGILYFGTAVTLPVQLDSVYTIQTYDTLMVSDPAGRALSVQVRNLFLEPDGDVWRVTDLFQIRSDLGRTLVAAEGGVVWRHPLPPGATDVTTGQSDLMPGGTEIRDGALLVRSAVPPGERVFVVRYVLPSPFLELPLVGTTETLELLVREPAPPLEAEGLTLVGRVELEPGSTYRRFAGEDFRDATVRLVEGQDARGTLPLGWIVVVLSMVLGAVALWATVGRGASPAVEDSAVGDRAGLIREVALLDRDFEALSDPTPEDRASYGRRRRRLVRRIIELD